MIVNQISQSDYMIGPQIRSDPYHVSIVRAPLTRSLGARYEDIRDEIAASFSDMIPANGNGILESNHCAHTAILIRIRMDLRPGLQDDDADSLQDQQQIASRLAFV